MSRTEKQVIQDSTMTREFDNISLSEFMCIAMRQISAVPAPYHEAKFWYGSPAWRMIERLYPLLLWRLGLRVVGQSGREVFFTKILPKPALDENRTFYRWSCIFGYALWARSDSGKMGSDMLLSGFFTSMACYNVPYMYLRLMEHLNFRSIMSLSTKGPDGYFNFFQSYIHLCDLIRLMNSQGSARLKFSHAKLMYFCENGTVLYDCLPFCVPAYNLF